MVGVGGEPERRMVKLGECFVLCESEMGVTLRSLYGGYGLFLVLFIIISSHNLIILYCEPLVA